MSGLLPITLLGSSLVCALAAPQVPFQILHSDSARARLKGRFLQITDIHPDPYYVNHGTIKSACHRTKKGTKKKKQAGRWGTPYNECDTPLRLSNFTLDYLEKNWASEIDFVVWTGDNARHDNDHKLPRTPAEIYDLNILVAKRMEEIFTSRGVAVVPSVGNNDVWQYNDSRSEQHYNEILVHMEEIHPFSFVSSISEGRVLLSRIAVIALNTMYFYDSNKAVGGCLFREPTDPGNLQLDWLEVQLKLYRDKGIVVWITGHVPPSPGNYYPECFVRYAELSLRFQDTILGGLFGHMNADHFFFMEANDLELPKEEDESRAKIFQREELYDAILRDFAELPKAKQVNMDDYHVINVSPPVVPNPYLPTFRVFSYNITNYERRLSDLSDKKKKKKGSKRKHGHKRNRHPDKDMACKKDQFRDTWPCHLNETWHSGGPARENNLYSPLGYAQYYIPDLESAKTHLPTFKLEYLTYAVENLHPSDTSDFHPVPLKQLPKSLQNESINSSKYAPYSLPDLTISSWVSLAQKLGNAEKHSHLRKKFREYMYLGAAEEG